MIIIPIKFTDAPPLSGLVPNLTPRTNHATQFNPVVHQSISHTASMDEGKEKHTVDPFSCRRFDSVRNKAKTCERIYPAAGRYRMNITFNVLQK